MKASDERIIKGKKVTTRLRVNTLNALKEELLKEEQTDSVKEDIEFIDYILDMKGSVDKKPTNNKKKPVQEIEQTNLESEPEREVTEKKKKRNYKDSSTPVSKEELEKEFYSESNKEVYVDLFGYAEMNKEIRKATVTLPDNQVRIMVDNYYQTQKYRISIENQLRALQQGFDSNDENPSILEWAVENYRVMESQMMKALADYSDSNPVTRWCKSIKGIGPVISSSLYAYFDVEGINYAGHFWSYAGLNDNNNPWLGTEKATAIVNELFKIRNIKNKAFKKVLAKYEDKMHELGYNFKFDEDKIKEEIRHIFSNDELLDIYAEVSDLSFTDLKSFKQINDTWSPTDEEEAEYEAMTIEEKVLAGHVSDPTLNVLNLNKPICDDDFVDYIFSITDNNVVSSNILYMLVEKLNNRRKYLNIVNQATEFKEDSKYKGLVTKKSLIAYLSKPPYNIKLKVLMWKIGESFRKVCNRGSLYGELYKERKAEETAKNSRGEYWEQAALMLKRKTFNKSTEAYKWYSQGMLPPKHIEERAKRYAVKIFISHLFECMYLYRYGKMPTMPYTISRMGHEDYISPEVPYENFM